MCQIDNDFWFWISMWIQIAQGETEYNSNNRLPGSGTEYNGIEFSEKYIQSIQNRKESNRFGSNRFHLTKEKKPNPKFYMAYIRQTSKEIQFPIWFPT